jgi:hypothetical protein
LQIDGQQQVLAPVVEQGCIRERARGDDAGDLAFDRTFRCGGIADLFAHRHRLAELHQLGEILLDGMEGHAGHLDRLAGRSAALGQRDVHQLCGTHGIFEEQLVEIAHAVEQQLVRMLCLDAQVLLHHWRDIGRVGLW